MEGIGRGGKILPERGSSVRQEDVLLGKSRGGDFLDILFSKADPHTVMPDPRSYFKKAGPLLAWRCLCLLAVFFLQGCAENGYCSHSPEKLDLEEFESLLMKSSGKALVSPQFCSGNENNGRLKINLVTWPWFHPLNVSKFYSIPDERFFLIKLNIFTKCARSVFLLEF